MSKRYGFHGSFVLFVTWATLVFVVGWIGSAQGASTGSSVSVMGRQISSGQYVIAVQTVLDVPQDYDALLVFAEPSHTLLLVQNADPENPAPLLEGEKPLATVSGGLEDTAPRVVVPYEVNGDTRIVVELVNSSGRTIVSDAKINVAAFQFSTTFSPEHGGPDRYARRHCVSCENCGEMCVECPGPKFSADCIQCTIDCGW